MPKRTKKTIINSLSREFVISLQDYFERENQNGRPLLPLSRVGDSVADALGIGRATVTRITKEKFRESSMEENKLSTPNKKKRRTSYITAIDSFDSAAIKNHIYAYYSRNELPTLNMLLRSLEEADLFKGSKPSLSKVLKNIGFTYKKSNKRKVIMERTDIPIKRCTFLKAAKKIEDWDRVVFFLMKRGLTPTML